MADPGNGSGEMRIKMREYGAGNGRENDRGNDREKYTGQRSNRKKTADQRPSGQKTVSQRPNGQRIASQRPAGQRPEAQGGKAAKAEITEPIRINKFLGETGFCSRREADRMIESGKVTVDGIPAEMGTKVLPGQRVCVNGKPVRMEEEEILLVVNKPIGIVCTTAEFDKDNIVDFINYPKRIYPIGRLDKDSSGLILMTNQGELVNKILRGGNHHEKEYMVRVNRPVTPEFVAAMEAGVVLDDGVRTMPCRVDKTGGYSFKIILMQGLNRQIRRMCEALDYRVTNLKRVRVMNIELGDLRVGSYRKVTSEEYAELRRRLENSTALSWAEAAEQGLVREPEVSTVKMAAEIKPVERKLAERKLAERRTVPERKLMAQTNAVSGRKPMPVKEINRTNESQPVSDRPRAYRPNSERAVFENTARSESANKSVIKRGEIKKTTGKNIVIRRPEK